MRTRGKYRIRFRVHLFQSLQPTHGAAPQYFPVTQPEILAVEFGPFDRIPAQEQVRGCQLAVLLEDLNLLSVDEVIPLRLQWLAFRQILRVSLRIGALPMTGISSGAMELAKTPWRE